MELLLMIMFSFSVMMILYRVLARVTMLRNKIEKIEKTIEHNSYNIFQSKQTLDDLYHEQLRVRGVISSLGNRIHHLEQRRPFPRKQKGRR
ncbi:hypothetical protein KBI51_09690 [Aerococcaceae bacterium zg-ZUI334]|uniref:hypothetical protein n=1 Tax=Aerococcaceae bacterium zg-252 TaxID=2796928 RepID=UPI001B8FA11A|nr:hypothetical protein [Aerococcaceae bacterium zg-ZUI334]